MRFKSYLIVLLMLMVVAAPVVDATMCKDCHDEDEVRLSGTFPRDFANTQEISAGAGSGSERDPSARDLCPFCSDCAAAMTTLSCVVPSAISHTYHLPKLLFLSYLSKSIAKPPQN